ncbi:DUF2513 domain-containing protein [Thalassobius sp. Cn5-15]|uniref:DUF2513 domain-containing protein n=1 Tax=Thalassobius sp. Cn5-15 TaxID=2917763 RepID=UPI001EF2E849|nr:DUF2513 domain-containing protein [Thalassobius sp. Cn5-15]MCG7494686.1 DUF2513 domain-containing protein [Thalassobius sp. Cn5-15]
MKLEGHKFKALLIHIESADDYGASFDDRDEGASFPYSEVREGLRLLRQRDLISGRFTKDGALAVKLTLDGHDYLADMRSDELLSKFVRWLGRQTDKVFSSVVLPVIAAVLTVIVMNYLGLAGK